MCPSNTLGTGFITNALFLEVATETPKKKWVVKSGKADDGVFHSFTDLKICIGITTVIRIWALSLPKGVFICLILLVLLI